MGGLLFQGLCDLLVSGRVALGRSDVHFFHCDFFRVSSPSNLNQLVGGRNWATKNSDPNIQSCMLTQQKHLSNEKSPGCLG